jgi:hypothetical protein
MADFNEDGTPSARMLLCGYTPEDKAPVSMIDDEELPVPVVEYKKDKDGSKSEPGASMEEILIDELFIRISCSGTNLLSLTVQVTYYPRGPVMVVPTIAFPIYVPTKDKSKALKRVISVVVHYLKRLVYHQYQPQDCRVALTALRDRVDDDPRVAPLVVKGVNRLLVVSSFLMWSDPGLQLLLPPVFDRTREIVFRDQAAIDFSFTEKTKGLQFLICERCEASLFPSQILSLENLRGLRLPRGIQSIPPQLFDLPRLSMVIANEIPLAEVPVQAGKLFAFVGNVNSALRELPRADATAPSFRLWTDSEFYTPRWALFVAILTGLGGDPKASAWSAFLKKGLYDPRLFLFIWPFVSKAFEWATSTRSTSPDYAWMSSDILTACARSESCVLPQDGTVLGAVTRAKRKATDDLFW